MKDEYYILSLTHKNPELLMWWRENNSGYTTVLDEAGKYSEEDVRSNPFYYDNHKETVAVPCAIAEEFAVKCVLNDCNSFVKLGVKER